MYDIIIIGSGPGGYIAAERAGESGKKVLIVEKERLGGVCLNEGCIPTKSLLYAAKTFRHAKEGEEFGVYAGEVRFDLARAMAWKEKTIAALQKGIASLMESRGVAVIYGNAVMTAPNRVAVDGTIHEAPAVIIASGSHTVVPPIPGIDGDRVVTSGEILSLRELPERIAVIGGGVIGVEFASFFSSLGKQTAVFEMLPEILPMMDRDMAAAMRKAMKDTAFHVGASVKRIDGKRVIYSERTDGADPKGGDQVFEADLILAATGRAPNTRELGLENIGVDVTKQGIVVDDRMRTNIPGVYAVGDATGKSLLAHSASRMGEVAVKTICGKPDRMRYDAVPWAVFSLPEAAGCGLTEREAREKGFDPLTASFPYRANGRFLAENGPGPGLCRMVSDERSGRILGIHLMGPYASEHIFGAALMLETELRVDELKEVVFPHPTVSEGMREAAFMPRK